MEALHSMQTATLRRRCCASAIEVYDARKSAAKGNGKRKIRRFRNDKLLVTELTKREMRGFTETLHFLISYRCIENIPFMSDAIISVKKRVDSEQHNHSLDDVENEEDIGELQRFTLKRLYKRHRITAIDSLHDVPFEDLEHLHHDVLMRLGAFRGLKTARKASSASATRRETLPKVDTEAEVHARQDHRQARRAQHRRPARRRHRRNRMSAACTPTPTSSSGAATNGEYLALFARCLASECRALRDVPIPGQTQALQGLAAQTPRVRDFISNAVSPRSIEYFIFKVRLPRHRLSADHEQRALHA